MHEVKLYGGKAAGRVALVDDRDYELVQSHRWHVWECQAKPTHRVAGPYAQARVVRPDGVATTLKMHKLLTGWRRTDHRNGNGLDNRRGNLRDVSNRQNLQNSRAHIGSSSVYKGVSWRTREGRSGRWSANITADGEKIHLGLFKDEVEAAQVYDRAAHYFFGEYALTNFPVPAGTPRRIPAVLARERAPVAKVTADQVREIWIRRKAGEGTVALGLEFGIEACSVSSIMLGRTWKRVTDAIPAGAVLLDQREETAA
jgi:hypothetical protein